MVGGSAFRAIGHQKFYRSHEQSLAMHFIMLVSVSFFFRFVNTYILLVTFFA